MKTNELNQSYDGALLTYTVLRRLRSGKMDTFEQRLRSQKIQYFAQLFKVSSVYKFNLYMRGPYSPDLTSDLFKISAKGLIDLEKFTPNELENRLSDLRSFVEGKDVRELEIAATLHWLMNVAKLSKQDTFIKLEKWKGVKKIEFKKAFSMINKIPKS